MTTLRLFILGRSGQVASALAQTLENARDVKAVFAGRPDADLCAPASIIKAMDDFSPDLVLNTAAYTAVDKAEDEPHLADQINHRGPAAIAHHADKSGVPFIQMSTDCVFDGAKASAYVESDATSPISAYGRSKALGETAVAKACFRSLIVRVCWVHSPFGGSFPRTMLRLAESRDKLTVVNDQWGRPTHANDLAEGLLTMAKGCLASGFREWGIYHLAGQGETERASMARAIFEDSERFGGPVAEIEGVSTEIYNAPAPRPLNARLDSERAHAVFGLLLPDWRARLTDTVRDIISEGAPR